MCTHNQCDTSSYYQISSRYSWHAWQQIVVAGSNPTQTKQLNCYALDYIDLSPDQMTSELEEVHCVGPDMVLEESFIVFNNNLDGTSSDSKI